MLPSWPLGYVFTTQTGRVAVLGLFFTVILTGTSWYTFTLPSYGSGTATTQSSGENDGIPGSRVGGGARLSSRQQS